MRKLSNTNRSISDGEAPRETGVASTTFTGPDYYQELILRANTVSILRIINHYGIRTEDASRVITCPLKSHNGGRERTPSFKFWIDTNTFYCFGCKAGSKPVDFVALMDGINRSKAAFKIIDIFNNEIGDIILDKEDYSKKMEIMMDFSNTIRNFRQNYFTDEAAALVELVCQNYDAINTKYSSLSNEALSNVVCKLKEKIESYGK
jgi:hypothetical protein